MSGLYGISVRFPWLVRARDALARLAGNTAGNVAIIFIVSSVAVSVFMGGAIDLARSYKARLKLNTVASMACQYAGKPSVLASLSGNNGQTTYVNSVSNYINTALTDHSLTYTQTVTSPFSFSTNGPATVNLSVSVPTAFMSIAGVNQVPVSASSYCFDSTSSLPSSSSNAIDEGFELSDSVCSWVCFINPTAGNSAPASAINTFPASPAYTGSSGSRSAWYIMGYCMEVDAAGSTAASMPQGSKSIELDCDNGSNSGGNSSITTKVNLVAGTYELRYFYSARIGYAMYNPAYLCGSAASDLTWATDGNSDLGSSRPRTNQINVYLDKATSSSAPTHTTIDGTQSLAGSNLIDMCVYSQGWIERSVSITIATSGDYWLSFAADGYSDSVGGLVDHIRLCLNSCSGTLQDNFPWTANTQIHQDTFENPIFFSSGNASPYSSTGTSGSSSSGWPQQTGYGWAAAPWNRMYFQVNNCPQGRQCVGSSNSENSFWSRPFLLVPGYYKLDYNYTTEVVLSGVTGTYCGATPTAANYSSLSGSANASYRVSGISVGSQSKDTATIGVMMSHPGLISQLNFNSWAGTQSNYTNPDGSVTNSPSASPVTVNLSSYKSNQNNPLVDLCIYSQSATSRTAYIKIQKPAWYWLTFAALGSKDNYTGYVDDVRLTAVASLYTSTPPSGAVTIPVPTPTPGSTTSFTGFSIIADPLAP